VQAAIGWLSIGADTVTKSGAAKRESLLTRDSVTNYARGRTVNARIEYRGWAGDPNASRTVRNSEALPVAVMGYPENPPDENTED